MPLDSVGAHQSWTIEPAKGKGPGRIFSNDPVLIEAVSELCRRRIDKGMALSTIVNVRAEIREWADASEGFYAERLHAFADFLDETSDGGNSKIVQAAQERFAAGVIQFDDLTLFFKRGDRVTQKERAYTTGAVITSSKMDNWTDDLGMKHRYVRIEMRVWRHDARGFASSTLYEQFDEFPGVRSIKRLGLRHIDQHDFDAYTKRGHKIRAMAFSPSHVEYEGPMHTVGGWYGQMTPATGRAMIDAKTLQKLDPELYNKVSHHNYNRRYDESGIKTQDVPDEELFAVVPRVIGFSLENKSWGLFNADQIGPADYNKEAFDLLVLQDNIKRLLRSQIRQSGKGFTDIIRGKGGGTTILLHGKAGVGKTLTAEAIAELLERPLYAISVGELGCTPAELEKGLKAVLSYASAWNAVLLLDEADIYMERRDANNIQRNAMVAIFLRLLEYYNGVLLLTTNRVRDFDEAFHSRIALAINYPSLAEDARSVVWRNLLQAAGVSTVDPKQFAGRDMNGRQIKNAIRMAQNLAADEEVPVSAGHFEVVLGVHDQFKADMLAQVEAA